jgi:hypothetical protein
MSANLRPVLITFEFNVTQLCCYAACVCVCGGGGAIPNITIESCGFATRILILDFCKVLFCSGV